MSLARLGARMRLALVRFACWLVPSFRRAVARENFRFYVHESLPEHIDVQWTRVDTGVTTFTYQPPFDRQRLLLNRFEVQDDTRHWFLHRVLLGDRMQHVTRCFYRHIDTPEAMAAVWLYLDDDAGRGAILVV